MDDSWNITRAFEVRYKQLFWARGGQHDKALTFEVIALLSHLSDSVCVQLRESLTLWEVHGATDGLRKSLTSSWRSAIWILFSLKGLLCHFLKLLLNESYRLGYSTPSSCRNHTILIPKCAVQKRYKLRTIITLSHYAKSTINTV